MVSVLERSVAKDAKGRARRQRLRRLLLPCAWEGWWLRGRWTTGCLPMSCAGHAWLLHSTLGMEEPERVSRQEAKGWLNSRE
jgi:hypothetical protein